MTIARRLRALVAAAAVAAVVAPQVGDHAGAATASTTTSAAAVAPQAFGMHWLNPSHPYPSLPFGTARIWDMGVTWADLQPAAPALPLPVDPTATVTGGDPLPQSVSGWDADALARLDGIVDAFRAHHADPLITLGMTPAWAAHACPHKVGDVDWGTRTCAPSDTSANGPWGTYVRTLAARYQGKVAYYELWNEPSLRNGYNDSLTSLAAMAATAQSILHSYGAKLVAPSIPFTNGSPKSGLGWLDTFLRQPGGTSFDVAGFHLYPTDAVARAGYGPEWAMSQLAAARAVLARHGMHVPVWNTEVNVGRAATRTTFTGARGAAQVARTFLLNLESGVARTIWYAADDRGWGGTWLENADYRTPTAAGVAEKTVYRLVVGARPRGCSRRTVGRHQWRYTCRFRLASGKGLLAVWTTGRSFTFRLPRGTQHVYSVTGRSLRRAAFHAGAAPTYVVGGFRV
jgi:hypothetical protein